MTIHLLANNSRFIVYEDRIPQWLPSLKYKPDCKELNLDQKRLLHGYFDQLRANVHTIRVDASVDNAKPAMIDLLDETNDSPVMQINDNKGNTNGNDKKPSSTLIPLDVVQSNPTNPQIKTAVSASSDPTATGVEIYIDFDSEDEAYPMLESIDDSNDPSKGSLLKSEQSRKSLIPQDYNTNTNNAPVIGIAKRSSLPPSTNALLGYRAGDVINISSSEDEREERNAMAGKTNSVSSSDLEMSSDDEDDDLDPVSSKSTLRTDKARRRELIRESISEPNKDAMIHVVSDDDENIFDSTAILPSLLSPHDLQTGNSGAGRHDENDYSDDEPQNANQNSNNDGDGGDEDVGYDGQAQSLKEKRPKRAANKNCDNGNELVQLKSPQSRP